MKKIYIAIQENNHDISQEIVKFAILLMLKTIPRTIENY